MFDVILISHGPLSKAMLESAELICGKQDHVKTFGLYTGDGIDEFRATVRGAIEESIAAGDVLVITDIMSGSPFNVTAAAMEDLHFQHITGMNLPLVIQVLLDRQDCTVDEVCDNATEMAGRCIVHVNKMFEEEDDGEFVLL